MTEHLVEQLGEEHKPIFEKMVELVRNWHSGMTPFQLRHFVLNDVEFPTEWGKFDQIKRELVARYDELVHLAFEIKRNEIKIQKKEQEAQKAEDPLDAELLRLDAEELKLQQERAKSRLAAVMRESMTLYAFYEQHAHLEALPPEEQAKLEEEQWKAKCKNMPLVFEERYGDDFMKAALGEHYEDFLALRRQGYGYLPREIVRAAQGQLSLQPRGQANLSGLTGGDSNASALPSR